MKLRLLVLLILLTAIFFEPFLKSVDYDQNKARIPYDSVLGEKYTLTHQPLFLLKERIQLLRRYQSKKRNVKNKKSLHSSIVEAADQITSFEARYELAKILSRQKKNEREAFMQYAILLKENPNSLKVWFKLSQLYMIHQQFSSAADILYALVYQQPLPIELIGYSPLKKRSVENKENSLHPSIVEAADQITSFEARYELAKILSRQKKNEREAFMQYAILLKENPNSLKVWFKLSQLYMIHQQFSSAADILYALVYHQPLNLDLLLDPLSNANVEASHSVLKSQKTLAASHSLIPTEDQIDDDKARLELARILSRHEKSLDEAIANYQKLLDKKPDDALLVLEISRLYIKQKKYTLALSLLYPALDKHSENVELLVEAAHAEHALSHPKQSQDLLLRALELAKKRDSILIDYASTLLLVGSFYKAEAIYKEALKQNPDSLDLTLNLAWTLVSAQRYEEAEGLYRKLLLRYPYQPKVLEALALLKNIEKEFDTALDLIEILRTLFPEKASYLSLQANILYKNESYLESLKAFDSLKNDREFTTQALIGKGRIYLKLGECEEAYSNFQKAYEYDSNSIEAQFYLAGKKVTEKSFISQIIEKTAMPEDLLKWANIYSENGMSGLPEFYQAALKIDPDYFPAQTGLAGALSANYEYQEALEIYLSILDSFPENSKIMLEIARLLSWGKNYEDSMDKYDEIIALNPQDPVPRREKARVAYWGKFFEKSMQIFQEFLSPTVDQFLWEALKDLDESFCHPFFSEPLALLAQTIESGSVYRGYEQFNEQFLKIVDCFDSKEKLKIETLLVDYLPLYRIQKSFYLESYAKALDWEGYILHALPIYQQLTEFSPGNEEALYSYAQDYCNIGLCKCSRKLYYHFLHLDPNHNLVKMALKRNLLREHTLLQTNYTYWRERGSGQFAQSQIIRQQFDELIQWSPSCNFHLRFMQNEWIEYPFFNEKYYPAEGQTIEVDRVFNGYIKGNIGATRKNYFNKFPSRYTCFSTLWFNLYDYATLGIGFERRNEIYNYFNLRQGTQAKVSWVALKATSHAWEAATTYRHSDYNDGNTIDHINLLLAYALTEDPIIFKLIFNGNYRNASHLTKTIVNLDGQIENVIYPYWTPDHYYAAALTLEFRYNYACFTYCEAPQRFFDLKVTGEDDTAQNPSIQVIFDWKHEWMEHWGFEISGLFHRSRLWNAEGFWGKVYYRF